jgi:DNA-3-methyladenine glycosylase I
MPKKSSKTASTRCYWAHKDVFHEYHDNEWGRPVNRDRKHFEFLILEGAQAGLSWETILKKRENYNKLFYNFDPRKVASLTNKQLDKILKDSRIVRNKLKVYSARQNAEVFLNIQKEYGSFNKYIWGFTNKKVLNNSIKNNNDLPSKTKLSDKISLDLKKRGMNFVGSTIIYAYLQAVGIVNDHENNCFCKSI